MSPTCTPRPDRQITRLDDATEAVWRTREAEDDLLHDLLLAYPDLADELAEIERARRATYNAVRELITAGRALAERVAMRDPHGHRPANAQREQQDRRPAAPVGLGEDPNRTRRRTGEGAPQASGHSARAVSAAVEAVPGGAVR